MAGPIKKRKEDLYFALTGLIALPTVFIGVQLNIYSTDAPLIFSISGILIFLAGIALKSHLGSNFNYIGRVFFHGVGGLFLIFFSYLTTKEVLVLLSFGLFLIFLSNLLLEIKGIKTTFYQGIISEKGIVRHSNYYSGTLWLLSFTTVGYLFNQEIVYISLLCLAVGDPIASLIGIRFGRHPNPLNSGKTLEGSLGFFFSSLLIGQFLFPPFKVLLAAFIGTLVEAFSRRLDDNLTVPFFVAATLAVFS